MADTPEQVRLSVSVEQGFQKTAKWLLVVLVVVGVIVASSQKKGGTEALAPQTKIQTQALPIQPPPEPRRLIVSATATNGGYSQVVKIPYWHKFLVSARGDIKVRVNQSKELIWLDGYSLQLGDKVEELEFQSMRGDWRPAHVEVEIWKP